MAATGVAECDSAAGTTGALLDIASQSKLLP